LQNCFFYSKFNFIVENDTKNGWLYLKFINGRLYLKISQMEDLMKKIMLSLLLVSIVGTNTEAMLLPRKDNSVKSAPALTKEQSEAKGRVLNWLNDKNSPKAKAKGRVLNWLNDKNSPKAKAARHARNIKIIKIMAALGLGTTAGITLFALRNPAEFQKYVQLISANGSNVLARLYSYLPAGKQATEAQIKVVAKAAEQCFINSMPQELAAEANAQCLIGSMPQEAESATQCLIDSIQQEFAIEANAQCLKPQEVVAKAAAHGFRLGRFVTYFAGAATAVTAGLGVVGAAVYEFLPQDAAIEAANIAAAMAGLQ
jgi:hypothetical protein